MTDDRLALGIGLGALLEIGNRLGKPVDLTDLRKIGFIKTGECSICGHPIGYRPDPVVAAVILDLSCDCGQQIEPQEGYTVARWEDLEEALRRGSET